MSVPTRGETYAKLMEHLRLAQEDAAMMSHLHAMEGGAPDKVFAQAWLNISEILKLMNKQITQLAMGRLQ